MYMQLRFRPEFTLQIAREGTVYFDRVQFLCSAQQMPRERAASRSYLYYSSCVLAASCSREALEDRISHQKMLPELAWQASV